MNETKILYNFKLCFLKTETKLLSTKFRDFAIIFSFLCNANSLAPVSTFIPVKISLLFKYSGKNVLKIRFHILFFRKCETKK